MFETNARKGLRLSVSGADLKMRTSYYNPVSWVSVDIEDALNAGHSVDPERGIQLCAETVGAINARSERSIAGFIGLLCVLCRRERFLRRATASMLYIQLDRSPHFRPFLSHPTNAQFFSLSAKFFFSSSGAIALG